MTHNELAAFAVRKTQTSLLRLAAKLRRAKRHPKDADAIHELRVSIRRYTQCLRTFEDLFENVSAERASRRLRKLMKLCGAARNCDVAQALLRTAGLPEDSSAYAGLVTERNQAEAKLVKHIAKKRWNGFAKRHRVRFQPNASAPLHWELEGSVAANARKALPPIHANFLDLGAAAFSAPGDYETLHQFRLSVKRFRYTLEIFRELYGPGIEPRLLELRQLQDRLGAINDCCTALELIGKRTVARRLVRKELVRRERVFRDSWPGNFGSGQAEVWVRWLEETPLDMPTDVHSNIVTVLGKRTGKTSPVRGQ